jgi:hypothetical protein
LRMAYVALKANSCVDLKPNNLENKWDSCTMKCICHG